MRIHVHNPLRMRPSSGGSSDPALPVSGCLFRLNPNAAGTLFSDQAGTTPASSIVRRIVASEGTGNANGNPSSSVAARIDTLSYPGAKALYFNGGATPFSSFGGLSLNRDDCTIMMDWVSVGCRGIRIPVDLGSNDLYLQDYTSARNTFYLQTFSGVENTAPNLPYVARRRTVFRNDGSNRRLRLNGTDYSGTAMSSVAITDGSLGGGASDLAPHQMVLRDFAVWDHAISDSDVDLLDTLMSARTATPSPVGLPLVVCDGNSLTYGYGVDSDEVWSVVAESSIGSGLVRLANFGTSGASTASLASSASTVIDPWYSASRTKNICIIWEGTNFLIGGGTASTTYAAIRDYARDRIAAGWTVIIGTTLPSTLITGAQETARTTSNQSIRDNAVAEGWSVADVAVIAALSDPTNGTYYSDGTHPTAAGQALVATNANGFGPAISSLL